jgi:hypothetical protein
LADAILNRKKNNRSLKGDLPALLMVHIYSRNTITPKKTIIMRQFFLLAFLVFFQSQIHAQNIGIGTNNPSRAKLELHGAVGSTSAIFGGEGTGISLQRNWPGIGFNSYFNNGHRFMSNGYGAVFFMDPINGYIALDMFGQGTTGSLSMATKRFMVMSKDGNLTLGGGNIAYATLEVNRGNGSSGTAAFLGTAYNSHFNFGVQESTHLRAGKAGGVVYINDIPYGHTVLSKYVSINGTDVDVPLFIKQSGTKGIILEDYESTNQWGIQFESINKHLELRYNNSPKGYFKTTDGAYINLSDNRLKQNVQPLSPSLQKLLQLKPLQYEMINENPLHQKSIGFIAQDVQMLFPELVYIISDTISGKTYTDLHTLNYTGLGVIAVKAIQEQQHIIQSLQAQVKELQEAISKMRLQH